MAHLTVPSLCSQLCLPTWDLFLFFPWAFFLFVFVSLFLSVIALLWGGQPVLVHSPFDLHSRQGVSIARHGFILHGPVIPWEWEPAGSSDFSQPQL